MPTKKKQKLVTNSEIENFYKFMYFIINSNAPQEKIIEDKIILLLFYKAIKLFGYKTQLTVFIAFLEKQLQIYESTIVLCNIQKNLRKVFGCTAHLN